VIYLPVVENELSTLVAQLNALDYKGLLIGDAVCLDQATLEASRRYIRKMVFPSHYPSNVKHATNLAFQGEYQKVTGKISNRWNVLGWDAMLYLYSALGNSNKIRGETIIQHLKSIRRFDAERSVMLFPDSSRVNHSFYLLQLDGSKLQLLKSPQQIVDEYVK
ncbi:MAG: ABC transporter substrate-binding protein, partial [bacterium]